MLVVQMIQAMRDELEFCGVMTGEDYSEMLFKTDRLIARLLGKPVQLYLFDIWA